MMRYSNLLDAFRHAWAATPDDLADALRRLPQTGEMLSPWATWTLIELARHRRRQLWGGDLILERLPGGLPRLEELCRTEQVIAGYIPGSPQWEYCIEGALGYCTLSDWVTGEVITVVISPEGDPAGYFFCVDLIRSWERGQLHGVGTRLLQLHPSLLTVHLAVEELKRCRLVEEVCIYEPMDFVAERLSPTASAHADQIQSFVEFWDAGKDRLWLAALVGDWLAAASSAIELRDPELMAITHDRAERCRTLRVLNLHKELAECYDVARHTALFDLGKDLTCGMEPLPSTVSEAKQPSSSPGHPC
jgi:hypothetical protein